MGIERNVVTGVAAGGTRMTAARGAVTRSEGPGTTRARAVRFCRYVVPGLALLWGAASLEEIEILVSDLGLTDRVFEVLYALATLDWRTVAVGVSLFHAAVAIGLVLERFVSWSPAQLLLALREESRRIGRTSVLLALPAVWDVLMLGVGLLRGFKLRECPSVEHVAGRVTAVESLQTADERSRREANDKLEFLDARIEILEDRLALGSCETARPGGAKESRGDGPAEHDAKRATARDAETVKITRGA